MNGDVKDGVVGRVWDAITTCVREILGLRAVAVIERETTLDTYMAEGVSSLDYVDLIMGLEQLFDIMIPDEVAGTCRTFGALLEAILPLIPEPA